MPLMRSALTDEIEMAHPNGFRKEPVLENPYTLPYEWWTNRIIFRTEVGSTAHGTGIQEQEDYDEIGVYFEPLSVIAGLDRPIEHVTYRPGRSEGEPSGPGDWDLMLYSARKWCRLAAQGNPSILVSIFGPRVQTTAAGLQLLDNHKWFWSNQARMRFLGYAQAQRERLLGIRGGRHVNRPILDKEFGYDTKYAMHMVRLGFQGIEYMQTGKIELPMDDERGDFLRSVRKGEIELKAVIRQAEALEYQLKHMESEAPDDPDFNAINQFLVGLAKVHTG